MQRTDARVGLGLALLALLVLWSARDFPAVPGQRVGAGFLPTIVGVGLLVGGLALWWRSRRQPVEPPAPGQGGAPAPLVPAFVVVAAIALYVLAAPTLGFLIVAPVLLLATFRALRVSWAAAASWAVAGTLVVHLTFYKLLRVPLPWGVLRPFY